MKNKYIEIGIRTEKAFRLHLEVVKHELDSIGIYDISHVQTLVVYHIGQMKRIAISDLINKGYYPGSNISYNVKKITENGYIEHHKSDHDKRSTVLTLTTKGDNLFRKLQNIFDKHVEMLVSFGVAEEDLDAVNRIFNKLEISWNSILLSRRDR